jgi:5-methylcytosine-specific restriction endonuclease McrA
VGNAGAALCLVVPLLSMIAALYALLYAPNEIARHLQALRRWVGGPLRRWRYRRYLRSAHWRALRKQVLRRAGGRCEACGRAGRLDVHHLTYARRGNELLGDLQALCRDCHDKAHGNARGRDPSRPLATPRRYQRGST